MKNTARNSAFTSYCLTLAWCLAGESLLAGTIVPQAPESGLVFRIPDIVVSADGSNPTTGMISALLDLTGDYEALPPAIASLNVAFELESHPAAVAFASPVDPASNRLITSGSVFSGATQLPHIIRFAKDASTPGAAVDGGLMVTVPFTIAAGVTSGTFPVRFISGNELGAPDATALPITLVDGSIHVTTSGPSFTGDYNGNGVVDAADYVVWRKTLGQSGIGLAADGSGNNVVDSADYGLWRANFGQAALALSSTKGIPEPATWLLLIAGLSAVLFARRQ